MDQIFIQKSLLQIKNKWHILEQHLKDIMQIPEFNDFLKHHKGYQSKERKLSSVLKSISQRVFQCLSDFFVNIFISCEISLVPQDKLRESLLEIEKCVNLALYYWTPNGDRNCPLRTLVHFLQLDTYENIFLNSSLGPWMVSIHEFGFHFGQPLQGSLAPFGILPVSKACALSKATDHRSIFSKTRTLQREISLLVDEWEFSNSILAIELHTIAVAFEKNQNTINEEAYTSTLEKANQRRNELAAWCLEALCDFQIWTQKSLTTNHPDITAEAEALNAILLAALQKIFLPASVSRLQYNRHVIELFQKFAQIRLKFDPDDYASHLLQQVTQSALHQGLDDSLFQILERKTFEWHLSFDPCSALKAFSWAYSKEHQYILCALLGIAYHKKSLPQGTDPSILCDLSTCFYIFDEEENESNAKSSPKISDHQKKLAHKTLDLFISYLKSDENKSPQAKEDAQFIISHIEKIHLTTE